MKLTKLTIIFILAFAASVSAQDEKPNIVWENLQSEYEKVEDIKPIIINKSKSTIYISPVNYQDGLYSVDLLSYNSFNKRWENQQMWICGFAANTITPIRLKPNKELKVNFSYGGFNFSYGIANSPFMPPLEEDEVYYDEVNKLEVKYKYKFRLNYSFKDSKTTQTSESSEFRIIED
ncbi:MAG: hypothetical protein ACR2MD_04370 [Aridibacter sp.]